MPIVRTPFRSQSRPYILYPESQATWTPIKTSPDSRVVYVDSSKANDAGDGLSPANAKKTIQAGVNLLRNGFPDHLRLKRGLTYADASGFGNWGGPFGGNSPKSGRSDEEPMVIHTYGTGARPIITGQNINSNGGAAADKSFLMFVSLDINRGDHGGSDCLGWVAPTLGLAFEDCVFREGTSGAVVQAEENNRASNVRFFRCQFYNNYPSGAGIANGMYCFAVDGLLIEECLYDTNGWDGATGADPFKHNAYLDNGNTGVQFRNNIVLNGASHGLQQRSGGATVGNLFARNAIAIVSGEGNYPEPGGVDCQVVENVVIDGRNIETGVTDRGWGIVVANIKNGLMMRNLIANNVDGDFPIAINVRGTHVSNPDGILAHGVKNLDIRENVAYKFGDIRFEGVGGVHLLGNRFMNNQQQRYDTGELFLIVTSSGQHGPTVTLHEGNTYYNDVDAANLWFEVDGSHVTLADFKNAVGDTTSVASQVTYTDPTRDLAAYMVAQGTGTTYDDFRTACKAQSKRAWDPTYTAREVCSWIRAGFDML